MAGPRRPSLRDGGLIWVSSRTVLGLAQNSPGGGPLMRVCVVCGAPLEGRRVDARHCGGPCRAEASRLKAILSGRGSGSHSSVMGQVGHADSKMTLDVYAQLEQRVDRQHGTSFDLLIRRAREELKGVARSPTTSRPTLSLRLPDPLRLPREKAANWSSVGHDPTKATTAAGIEEAGGRHEAHQQADSEVARGRIELPTPRFSVVCSTN
jgi:hypothetical protein